MQGELRVLSHKLSPAGTVGSPPATAPAQHVVPHELALCTEDILSGGGQGPPSEVGHRDTCRN